MPCAFSVRVEFRQKSWLAVQFVNAEAATSFRNSSRKAGKLGHIARIESNQNVVTATARGSDRSGPASAGGNGCPARERVQGAGFRVQGAGCRFRVQGAGFRVQDSGVQRFGCKLLRVAG